MAFIDYISIPDHPAIAPDTPLGQMAREAAKLVNSVNDNFPDWARPVPRIILPWGDALKDWVADPNPNAAPALPFQGGQCCSTTYEVTLQYNTPQGPQTQIGTITGRLGAPRIITANPGQVSAVVPYYACDGVERFIFTWGNVDVESYAQGFYTAPNVVAVIPQFGGSNNCGDPLPTFPPTIPTPDDLTRTAPIVIAPNLTIPVAFVYIRPEVDVNVDVDARINIPVTVDLPDIGINFNFDAGGITINLGGGGNTTVLPDKPDIRDPSPKPTTPPGTSDTDLTFIRNQLKRIREEIDDIKDCACGPNTIIQTQSYPAAESRTIALPAKTFLVRMTITETPANTRKQFGFNGPDVLYAGWAAFGYAGGGWSERMPIDYAEKSFIPPREAQGFSYTCYTLTKATITVYYEVVQP